MVRVQLTGSPGRAGIVGGQLGLAHPAHPGQHLAAERVPTHQDRGLPTRECLAQANHFGPGLETARLRRDHPHLMRPRDRRPPGPVVVVMVIALARDRAAEQTTTEIDVVPAPQRRTAPPRPQIPPGIPQQQHAEANLQVTDS
ncbi:hypothetical protein [Streptomyces sp. NPDC001816]|uniref:hypothetical protein n=1 Tax=Streptomyces sp. NPDC001816 TaxID=3364612 RepID=UPI0036AB5066